MVKDPKAIAEQSLLHSLQPRGGQTTTGKSKSTYDNDDGSLSKSPVRPEIDSMTQGKGGSKGSKVRQRRHNPMRIIIDTHGDQPAMLTDKLKTLQTAAAAVTLSPAGLVGNTRLTI
jgi:hypothetical protein